MKWDEDKPKFWLKALSMASASKSLDENIKNAIPNFYDGVWFDDQFNDEYDSKKWIAKGTESAEDTFKRILTYVNKSKLPYKNNVFTYQTHTTASDQNGPRLNTVLFAECPDYDNSVEVVNAEAEDFEGIRDHKYTKYIVCVTDETLQIKVVGIKGYDEPILFYYDSAKHELQYESAKDLLGSDTMDYAIVNIQKLTIGLDLLHQVSTTNESTFNTVQPKLDQSKKFINLKRSKKGKLPICEWITGVYDPKSSYKKITNIKGTHASPREHHRRGHWRVYKSGKRGWVKPAKVGDESNGVLRKTLIIGQSKEEVVA
jgi:hypothetical protein